jgi:cell shape-determining protein MreC
MYRKTKIQAFVIGVLILTVAMFFSGYKYKNLIQACTVEVYAGICAALFFVFYILFAVYKHRFDEMKRKYSELYRENDEFQWQQKEKMWKLEEKLQKLQASKRQNKKCK